jgi:15-cis-phytoene synthase
MTQEMDKLAPGRNGQIGLSDEDLRLVRLADEDRWLASRFAPADQRAMMELLLVLFREWNASRTASGETMINAIRLAWWRDQLGALLTDGQLRADRPPVLAALHGLAPDAGLGERLLDVLSAHQSALEQSGEAQGSIHARIHAAELSALIAAAGEVGETLPVDDLARFWVERRALTDLSQFRKVCFNLGKISPSLWPVIGYLCLIPLYQRAGATGEPGRLSRRWSLFCHALSGRI